MRVIAENIANADSTAAGPGGTPYRRQTPIFQTSKIDGASGVRLAQVLQDNRPFKREYDPGNPAADADGYVQKSNADGLAEMLDMKEAQRAYEANLNVIDAARAMDNSTLDILKK
jgi:flagellar basal-body rod protein FlgC